MLRAAMIGRPIRLANHGGDISMRIIAVFILVLALAPVAEASIILDFESFRQDDALLHDHAGVLTISGFTLTSVPPPGNAFRFVSAGTLHPLYAGSTGLWNGQSNALNVLAREDGGAFNLLSIDLADLPPGANESEGPFNGGPYDLTFTGATAGGGVVSNTFTINNTFLQFETFSFVGFENVLSVSWLQGSGFNPPTPPGPGEQTHQFDKIVVEAVPEPSSVALWALMAVVGWRCRRARFACAAKW